MTKFCTYQFVFSDQHLYRSLKETFPEETEKNVINVVDAMMNAVQILYDDDSLEHRVNLAIKRIEVMGEDLNEYDESKNVQELLRDFCKVSPVKFAVISVIKCVHFHEKKFKNGKQNSSTENPLKITKCR